MFKHSKSLSLAAVLGLILMSVAVYAASQAQDKPVDTKKLYAEMAGDYDFDFQGQAMVINLFEKDGKLFGAPVGETPEEMIPVKGSLMKFEITPPGGQLYELEFVRNEKGEIDKCIVKSMGMELVGLKRVIKK